MKDVKEQSIFEKVNTTINKNQTPVLGFIILVLVVFGGITVYNTYNQTFEDKAQTAFFEAERLRAENNKPADTKDAKVAVPANTAQIEEKLNSVINDYPKSKAGLQASALLADIQLEKKDSAKAIQTLERGYSQFTGHLLDSLLALKLSGLYEQNKQCDKALPVLAKIYNSKVAELKPEALLRQALCEETLGQKDKAKQSYQKLATEYSDSSQGQQAQKFLKIMDNNS